MIGLRPIGLAAILLLIGAGPARATGPDKLPGSSTKAITAPAPSPTRPPAPSLASVALPGRPGWTVDERTGCWLWNAVPAPGETVRWSGACPTGPAEGEGQGEWRTGPAGEEAVETFSGVLRSGRLDGRVRYAWPNGNRYKGDFAEGRRHGFGIFTWSNGERYMGQWRDGIRSGRGVLNLPGGDRYEGEWRDNRPDGFGTLTAADYTTYAGTWRAACFNDLRRRYVIGRPAAECP